MLQKFLTELAINYPKRIMWGAVLFSLVALAAFPSLSTDTDPVKMLPRDNHAVTLYNQVKEEFGVYDLVAIGISSTDGSSLFTVDGLAKVHAITGEILEIRDEAPSQSPWMKAFRSIQFLREDTQASGVDDRIIVEDDVMSLSTVDDIIRNQKGELLLTPLMGKAPATEAEAGAILGKLNKNPILHGKLAAEDGSLIGIYLPLQKGKKDRSFYLGEQVKQIVEKHLGPNERYYLAGLPIAENTFGNEMFIQMGLYAPAAGLVIFLLMLFFFRSIKLVVAPMLLGMMVVTWAMAGLIYAGQTVHIMSSMIPIFLLPIAVLNSIHILSKLHDRINNFPHRADAIRDVMGELFNPMLFTSLTTMVGFASLATTGIPPVVAFGITVGGGVFLSWLLSMLFIPAYAMLLPKSALKNFGAGSDDKRSVVMEAVQMFKGIATKAPHLVVLAALVSFVVAGYGLTKVVINDNPVRWFKDDHTLRQADRVMNKKLAGTYMANLYFTLGATDTPTAEDAGEAVQNDAAFGEGDDPFAAMEGEEVAPAPSIRDAAVIGYMQKVQNHLLSLRSGEGEPIVGGVTSILDILRKVGAVAMEDSSLPETREGVSQYMFLFESGDRKKGKDMWKFITPGDSPTAQMWVQLKTGDNQVMSYIMTELDKFMQANPPPTLQNAEGKDVPLAVKWTGLSHINNVWQEEMVSGMTISLLSSFFIVFLMMTFLFRSFTWGVISMLPLTLTIMMIYGAIGFSGKFYDMPIAVLSSLTLGLSVDFAIHFIEHTRSYNARYGNIGRTLNALFDGTAQAIWRNVLVISVGFLPLFFAGLVPYVTVGFFFFAIMLVSGITTLILLPSILRLYHKWLPGCQAESVSQEIPLQKSA